MLFVPIIITIIIIIIKNLPEWASLVLLVHLWISLEHPHLPPAGTDGGGGNDDDDEEEGEG